MSNKKDIMFSAQSGAPLVTFTCTYEDGTKETFSHEDLGRMSRFKEYVHRRLDEAGIAKDPPGEHRDRGCRIGQRLDIVLAPGNPQCKSVLQDWVMRLPLREQGTLLTGVRGCDLTPKYPLDSIERLLVGHLRWAFLNPADPREVDREPGCFFISKPLPKFKASALGQYPQHWYSHLMHCYEVVGYRHPDKDVAMEFFRVYTQLAHNLHLTPETRQQMIERLGEDRIAKGTVVS